MADLPNKNSGGGDKLKHTMETFLADSLVFIFILLIVGSFLGRLSLVTGSDTGNGLASLLGLQGIIDWFKNIFYPIWVVIAALVSFLFLWGIIYAVRRIEIIHHDEYKKYHPTAYIHRVVSAKPSVQKIDFSDRWAEVLKHASSSNMNDWKIAILDADSILDDSLKLKGYQGDTLGDRLKAVDRADLKNLDAAWEAHKYRNGIAHGGDIEFNQHEVRRIISYFERTLKEFSVI